MDVSEVELYDLPPAVIRELTLKDMERVGGAPALGPGNYPKRTLQVFRDRHHALARYLASGMTVVEASALTGYTTGTIHNLQGSPDFIELKEHYKGCAQDEFRDFNSALASLGKQALVELQNRLEENPEHFSSKELRELTSAMMDRIGHGPQTSSKNVNINVNLADRMEAARKRVIEGKVIDA